MNRLLPTTLVGSYPQPNWLIDRSGLSKQAPPRIRAQSLWRVAPDWLEQAQDDATLLAVRDQERAGIDVLTDGEMRRESYSNRFATALAGLDLDNPGAAPTRRPGTQPVPRVVGKIRRLRPVEVRDVAFLRRNTDRPIKITVPGPVTMSQQAQDDFYGDEAALAMDYAAAVNAEVRDLFSAGADVVQLDEPYLQSRPEAARRFAVEAIDRALEGASGTTALHLCFGYAVFGQARPEGGYSFLPELARSRVDQISVEAAQPDLDCAVLEALGDKTVILGVLNLGDPEPETSETVAARIRRALAHVSAERLVIAPDCGMKYLPRPLAFAKLKAMTAGAAMVRAEIESGRAA